MNAPSMSPCSRRLQWSRRVNTAECEKLTELVDAAWGTLQWSRRVNTAECSAHRDADRARRRFNGAAV